MITIIMILLIVVVIIVSIIIITIISIHAIIVSREPASAWSASRGCRPGGSEHPPPALNVARRSSSFRINDINTYILLIQLAVPRFDYY